MKAALIQEQYFFKSRGNIEEIVKLLEKQDERDESIKYVDYEQANQLIHLCNLQAGSQSIEDLGKVKIYFENILNANHVHQIRRTSSSQNQGFQLLCSQKTDKNEDCSEIEESENDLGSSGNSTVDSINKDIHTTKIKSWVNIRTLRNQELSVQMRNFAVFQKMTSFASQRQTFKYQILQQVFYLIDLSTNDLIEIAFYEDSPYLSLPDVPLISHYKLNQLHKNIIEALFFIHVQGIAHNRISFESIFYDQQTQEFVLGDITGINENIVEGEKEECDELYLQDLKQILAIFIKISSKLDNKINGTLSLYIIEGQLYEQINIIEVMKYQLSLLQSPAIILQKLVRYLDLQICLNFLQEKQKDSTINEIINNSQEQEQSLNIIQPKYLIEVLTKNKQTQPYLSDRSKEDFQKVSEERFQEILLKYNNKCSLKVNDSLQILQISSQMKKHDADEGESMEDIQVDMSDLGDSKAKVVCNLQMLTKYLFKKVHQIISMQQGILEIQGDNNKTIRVNLGEYSIQGEEIFIFINLVTEQTQFTLRLQSPTITDKLLYFLALNQNLYFLSHLSLSKCVQITSDAISHFIDNCPSESLSFLDLSGCPIISNSLMESLALSPVITTLTHLNISNCHLIDQSAIEMFCNSQNAISLIHLDLSGLSVPEILFTSEYTKNIQILILNQCIQIPSDIFSLLSNSKSFKCLKNLSISGSVSSSSTSHQQSNSIQQTFE